MSEVLVDVENGAYVAPNELESYCKQKWGLEVLGVVQVAGMTIVRLSDDTVRVFFQIEDYVSGLEKLSKLRHD